jgi:fibronectin-binding autotransporter adhesin
MSGTLDAGLLALAAGGTLAVLDGGLGEGTAGNALSVTGDFAGTGGTLVLDTALDDATRLASDRLVVGGDVTGTTMILINNTTPGLGKATSGDGILLVDVGGTAAAGAFSLAGPVSAGAFSYRLDFGGAADADRNFYLVSDLTAEGSLYQATPYLLASAFADLPGLVKRHAGRVPAGDGGQDGSSSRSASPLDSLPGLWARMEGRKDNVGSSNGDDYATSNWVMKAGYDVEVGGPGAGRLLGGGYLVYARADSSVTAKNGSGGLDSQGFGLGATATYFLGNGSYADLQGQVLRVTSDLDTKSGVLSTVGAASLELGHVFALGPGTSLIPSAQIEYADVGAASFVDDRGDRISDFGGAGATGRLGVAFQTPLAAAVPAAPMLTASLDIIHAFSAETGVTVREAEIETSLPENWLEAGLGIDWAVGTASVLNLSAAYALAPGEDVDDNSSFSGSANLRIDF